MFTVEIKINGTMIQHIYGHNEDELNDKGEDKYTYDMYDVQKHGLSQGVVWHKREGGIKELIIKILKEEQ